MPWIVLAAAIVLALSAQAGAETPPGRSAGCGGTAALPARLELEVAGTRRHALVAAPRGYDPAIPHHLVFAFHGRTNTATQARQYFRLEPAARAPTIFVYPEALRAADGRFAWSDPHDPPGRLRDYALFDALLDGMAASFCIDPGAVFVAGHSLGASFASSLACARGDRIRGVVAVAGGIVPSKCVGQVGAVLIHNPRDALVPIAEGRRALDTFLAQNGLAGERPDPVGIGGIACRRYGPDPDGNPVLWCQHDEDGTNGRRPSARPYPHTWPAGAGEIAMTFFEDLAD